MKSLYRLRIWVIFKLFLWYSRLFSKNTKQYYNGPRSLNYDGNVFFNNVKTHSKKGFKDFLLWRSTRKAAKWPKIAEPKRYDVPPNYITDKDSIRVSMVGHSTVLLQIKGMNILTDPIWSKRASPFSFIGPKRSILPGIKFEDLPPIHVVLISHNHYDHMDYQTIKKLTKLHNPLFITPLGNDVLLKSMVKNIKVKTLDWYHSISLNQDVLVNNVNDEDVDDKVKIHCYPAYHWSARRGSDKNKALWGAFIIESSEGNIYFAGDTGYIDGMNFKQAADKFKEFKLALMPIGAYSPRWFMSSNHLNPKEALKALKLLNTQYGIPIHYGVFPLADDGFDEAISSFRKLTSDLVTPKILILEPGEAVLL